MLSLYMLQTLAQLRGESGNVRLTLYDAAFERTNDGRLRPPALPHGSWRVWLVKAIDSNVRAGHRGLIRKTFLCRECHAPLHGERTDRHRFEFWVRPEESPLVRVAPFRVRVEAPAVCCTACEAFNVVSRHFNNNLVHAQTKILSGMMR
ncbi:MAG TPA: hypothetical protein VF681_15910 [Abditibacteriaceae bacterium]|jgi:hypothetical protein